MTPRRRALVTMAIVLGCFVWLAVPVAATNGEAEIEPWGQAQLVLYSLAWLMPLGIALVAVGVSDPSRAHRVATSLPLALAASLLGYYFCGYAFQWGGIGLVLNAPGLGELVAEWSPLDLRLGAGWGLVGVRGFTLPSHIVGEEGLTLLVSQLPLVTTAALIPLLALDGRTPSLLGLLLATLVASVCYPLVGNWVQGGGWLSQLGQTLRLGQGFVDHGLSSLHLVGAGAALAGLVAFRRRQPTPSRASPPELPRAYLPLNVLTGAVLALIGWLVMILSQPLSVAPESPAFTIFNALLGVAAAALATLFYGWLVRGEPDPGLTGRGILAATVAVGAGLPFIPPWSATLVGGLCGLLLAPSMYLVEHVLRLEDRGATLSVHGASAILGLVAVGLFADGRGGQAWGAEGSSPLGVTGYLMGSGSAGGAGQLYAQLIGVGAILVLASLVPWALLSVTARAYQLPPKMRARSRQRAMELEQAREAQEVLKRQGRKLTLWQKARQAWLRAVAAPSRRLLRRRRVARSTRAPRPKKSGGLRMVRHRRG